MYKISKKSSLSKARTGILTTRKGDLLSPFFMPIATKGSVKYLSADDMRHLKSQILLSNTYHLYLKPGTDILDQAGGLHEFIDWDKPILTDSGGFQVFSLSKIRKIKEEGVEFQSHIDGSKHILTPEKAIQIQKSIGSDIVMVLDECTPYPCEYEYAQKSQEMTTRWAARCLAEFNSGKSELSSGLIFGIVQGSLYEDLRKKSAAELIKLNFDGYAIGGLAVGEPNEEMYQVLDYLCPELPEDKPRYLMGVGKPENIIEAVKRGVDMFDCVIPTREARHGRLYLWKDNQFAYENIIITNEKFKNDFSRINSDSDFPELNKLSKAYLRHLFKVSEPLAQRLATINNLEFYLELMRRLRLSIEKGLI